MRRLSKLFAFTALVAVLASPISPAHASGRLYEKAPNLDIARRVRVLLARAGVPVVMTRTSDRTTSLSSRTGLANRKRVDAFISMHNNAAPVSSADWSEVYHQLRGGGSKTLGDAIRRALAARLNQAALLKTRRGDHGDYYYQLRTTKMPAVIVESAFVSNRREARLLATSSTYRQAIALAIVDGIMAYQRTLRRTVAPEFAVGPRVEVPAMSPPQDVRGGALNSHTVRFTWSVSQLPAGDVIVYRDGVALGRAAMQDGAFEDVWAAPGQTYRYELRATVPGAPPVTLESPASVVRVHTPPIVVCLDPGHGGRDTGAIGRF